VIFAKELRPIISKPLVFFKKPLVFFNLYPFPLESGRISA
jgi:hypothetical protein